ncbi:MAG: sugar-binding transcriptional regulator [Anaerolineales bacterium]
MPESYMPSDRASLLADVAEMYYLEEKGQAEIARVIGMTRSMVSRLLTEAREKGIVEVQIHRVLSFDHELETALIKQFDLKSAQVVVVGNGPNEQILNYLGSAGAQLLKRCLTAGLILGLSWGTSVSATVDALTVKERVKSKIIQLVGALGARNAEYDGHALVQRLAEKLGGEGYYLNAPFLCSDPETAASLRKTRSVKETLGWGKKAKVALVGIGSAEMKYSSYYLAGYVASKELEKLQQAGAVGDVCGLHFNIAGQECGSDFCERSVTIRKRELLKIPARIGIAGGPGKGKPVLGALRGGYVNMLVTDNLTARQVLDLANE